MAEDSNSLVAARSNSRITEPNIGRDPKSGNACQSQLEIPQSKIASTEDVGNLPVMNHAAGSSDLTRPLVSDIASLKYGTTMGEVDRYNMQRVVGLTANISGEPLGKVANEVHEAIARAGAPPRGVFVYARGQVPPFEETFSGLRNGLLLSVVVVFLLLAANFQSLLNRLEKFYGRPKPPHPTDPYEMILYINSAYPATDASCAKVFDALKRSVGLRIDDILAAPKGKLTEIMKLGGIFPEQRAVRLKEIAALVKHTFAGDLRTVLKRPLPQARKALKQFPTIGDPSAD